MYNSMHADLERRGTDQRGRNNIGERRTTFKIDLENLKNDKFKTLLPVKNIQSQKGS